MAITKVCDVLWVLVNYCTTCFGYTNTSFVRMQKVCQLTITFKLGSCFIMVFARISNLYAKISNLSCTRVIIAIISLWMVISLLLSFILWWFYLRFDTLSAVLKKIRIDHKIITTTLIIAVVQLLNRWLVFFNTNMSINSKMWFASLNWWSNTFSYIGKTSCLSLQFSKFMYIKALFSYQGQKSLFLSILPILCVHPALYRLTR